MTGDRTVSVPATDPAEMMSHREDLTDAERHYIRSARSTNTMRGYQSDWKEWCAWCHARRTSPQPAAPTNISQYLTELAGHGAKVGTMSRRLSSIRFAHRVKNLPDPTTDARVATVWEGIRRDKGAPPEQADPLMPPELNRVLELCPTIRSWKNNRADEPHLGGLRDRALLTIGFFGALRRSEIAAITTDHIETSEQGLVLHIPSSKTNQYRDQDELIILPRSRDPLLCPVTNLNHWLEHADQQPGPLLRQVTRHNTLGGPLSTTSINNIVQNAIRRAGVTGRYSAHSLRAGFVTFAHLRGASERAIAHQTRHHSLATLNQYVRINDIWIDNAATQLGL